MKNWFSRNLKNIISLAFVIPILLVAFVSISHVTSFYGLSNPFTWAIYLSVGIEIAALSALAAVSVNMGRFVYFPFIIVTFIQMLGNIFFSFTYIDETSQTFQDWIAMVGGLFENMGIEKTDLNTHKTVLSFLTGGLLPIISLTFAHMLVKFTEKNKEIEEEKTDLTEDDIQKIIETQIEEKEKEKWTPSQDDLDKFEEILKNIYPTKNKVKEEPYQPSEDELMRWEKILESYNVKKEDEVKELKEETIEEPTTEPLEDETITEENQYRDTVYGGLLDRNIETEQQPEEVEKKNNELSESGEVYKVLNYKKRDA